jgi:hypothetical protein
MIGDLYTLVVVVLKLIKAATLFSILALPQQGKCQSLSCQLTSHQNITSSMNKGLLNQAY